MNNDSLCALVREAENCGCRVVKNADLKKYTTFKIGGTAECVIEIDNREACLKLIPMAHGLGLAYYVFGNGSNIIADDKGIDAVIFHMNGGEIKNDGEMLTCFAGVKLAGLCVYAMEHELGGLEFAYGIPGTVGGAVYMNAGAYGGEIKDVIVSAEAMDVNGNVTVYNTEQMELSYRNSIFENNGSIILSASFKLYNDDKSAVKARMDEIIEKRRSKQPLEYPSAGSTFKRPSGNYASLLIEQCGLKGLSVGGAEVSQKHSGFIINKGNASFDDVMELIDKVKYEVKIQTGYELECEPVIIRSHSEFD